MIVETSMAIKFYFRSGVRASRYVIVKSVAKESLAVAKGNDTSNFAQARMCRDNISVSKSVLLTQIESRVFYQSSYFFCLSERLGSDYVAIWFINEGAVIFQWRTQSCPFIYSESAICKEQRRHQRF